MRPYPGDEDEVAPGYDPTTSSLEEAKQRCRSCIYCSGEGIALIYHMLYKGHAVDYVIDGLQRKAVCRRTVAYCLCEAGEKLAANHERTSKDVFKRIKFLLDILANRYPEWSAEDPTTNDENEGSTELPDAWRHMLARRMNPNHPES